MQDRLVGSLAAEKRGSGSEILFEGDIGSQAGPGPTAPLSESRRSSYRIQRRGVDGLQPRLAIAPPPQFQAELQPFLYSLQAPQTFVVRVDLPSAK